MSSENLTTPSTTTEPVLQLSDDAIAIVRDLIQLSILTGTNIVDHFRSLRLEAKGSFLVPSEIYVKSYNELIVKLEQEAEEAHAAQTKSLVTA